MLRVLCVAIVAATAYLVVVEVGNQPHPYANPVPVVYPS
jgi:hypothetical protein